MYTSLSQLVACLFVAHVVHAAVRVKFDSGEILTVDDEKSIIPTVDSESGSPVGGISARDLFGRQYCSAPGINVICGGGCCPNSEYCCERTSCIDLTTRICCSNGRQCYRGGQCCQGGNCVCRAPLEKASY